jgi:hypothetical protein
MTQAEQLFDLIARLGDNATVDALHQHTSSTTALTILLVNWDLFCYGNNDLRELYEIADQITGEEIADIPGTDQLLKVTCPDGSSCLLVAWPEDETWTFHICTQPVLHDLIEGMRDLGNHIWKTINTLQEIEI